MPLTVQNVAQVFRYHAPRADQLPKYEAIRAMAREFARTILDHTPSCADQQAALRHVREAVMTANAAIALDGEV